MTTDIQNLKSFDPFAEADDNTGEPVKSSQANYIHIRIQRKSPPTICAHSASGAGDICTPSPSLRARLTSIPTERNGRKTLTTVQGLPKKFDQKKILKVIKKKFACNGTVVDTEGEMGEVIQLQGDQRKDVQDFLTDKKDGLGLEVKTIKVHGF